MTTLRQSHPNAIAYPAVEVSTLNAGAPTMEAGNLYVTPRAWQPSALSYAPLIVDSSGNLLVSGGGSATTDELTELDVASSTVTYVGNAAIGSLTSASVWKIKRLTSTVGGNLSIKYAAGVATYSQVWDNRASLSYS